MVHMLLKAHTYNSAFTVNILSKAQPSNPGLMLHLLWEVQANILVLMVCVLLENYTTNPEHMVHIPWEAYAYKQTFIMNVL